MPPLLTELLLFHPGRNVVFGMPIFVGYDTKRLLRMLRGHGERRDNASLWGAGFFDDPSRITLRVAFKDSPISRYARCLLKDADATWSSYSIPEGFDAAESGRVQHGASIEMPRAWLATRGDLPHPISATEPGKMKSHKGYWFPCDGAVAFDLSSAPEKPKTPRTARLLSAFARFDPHVADAFETELMGRLMAQTRLIDALRERAECCFLFRIVVAEESRRSGRTGAIDIRWRRSTRLHLRHGRLLEADLMLPDSFYLGHGSAP